MIRIREIRKEKGITQERLSKALNIRQSTVAMWENGTNMPRADKLPELAKTLGCDVSDLFETKTG
mgnify:CR=1 FL=1